MRRWGFIALCLIVLIGGCYLSTFLMRPADRLEIAAVDHPELRTLIPVSTPIPDADVIQAATVYVGVAAAVAFILAYFLIVYAIAGRRQ